MDKKPQKEVFHKIKNENSNYRKNTNKVSSLPRGNLERSKSKIQNNQNSLSNELKRFLNKFSNDATYEQHQLDSNRKFNFEEFENLKTNNNIQKNKISNIIQVIDETPKDFIPQELNKQLFQMKNRNFSYEKTFQIMRNSLVEVQLSLMSTESELNRILDRCEKKFSEKLQNEVEFEFFDHSTKFNSQNTIFNNIMHNRTKTIDFESKTTKEQFFHENEKKMIGKKEKFIRSARPNSPEEKPKEIFRSIKNRVKDYNDILIEKDEKIKQLMFLLEEMNLHIDQNKLLKSKLFEMAEIIEKNDFIVNEFQSDSFEIITNFTFDNNSWVLIKTIKDSNSCYRWVNEKLLATLNENKINDSPLKIYNKKDLNKAEINKAHQNNNNYDEETEKLIQKLKIENLDLKKLIETKESELKKYQQSQNEEINSLSKKIVNWETKFNEEFETSSKKGLEIIKLNNIISELNTKEIELKSEIRKITQDSLSKMTLMNDEINSMKNLISSEKRKFLVLEEKNNEELSFKDLTIQNLKNDIKNKDIELEKLSRINSELNNNHLNLQNELNLAKEEKNNVEENLVQSQVQLESLRKELEITNEKLIQIQNESLIQTNQTKLELTFEKSNNAEVKYSSPKKDESKLYNMPYLDLFKGPMNFSNYLSPEKVEQSLKDIIVCEQIKNENIKLKNKIDDLHYLNEELNKNLEKVYFEKEILNSKLEKSEILINEKIEIIKRLERLNKSIKNNCNEQMSQEGIKEIRKKYSIISLEMSTHSFLILPVKKTLRKISICDFTIIPVGNKEKTLKNDNLLQKISDLEANLQDERLKNLKLSEDINTLEIGKINFMKQIENKDNELKNMVNLKNNLYLDQEKFSKFFENIRRIEKENDDFINMKLDSIESHIQCYRNKNESNTVEEFKLIEDEIVEIKNKFSLKEENIQKEAEQQSFAQFSTSFSIEEMKSKHNQNEDQTESDLLKEEINGMKERMGILEEINNASESKIRNINFKNTLLSNEIRNLNSEKSNLMRSIELLQVEVQSLNKAHDEDITIINNLNEKLKNLELFPRDFDQNIKNRIDLINIDNNSGKSKDIQNCTNKQIKDLKVKIVELEENSKFFSDINDLLRDQIRVKVEEIDRLKKNIENIVNSNNFNSLENQNEIKSLKNELSNQIKENNLVIDNLYKSNHDLKNEISNLNRIVEEKDKHIQELNKFIDRTKSSERKSRIEANKSIDIGSEIGDKTLYISKFNSGGFSPIIHSAKKRVMVRNIYEISKNFSFSLNLNLRKMNDDKNMIEKLNQKLNEYSKIIEDFRSRTPLHELKDYNNITNFNLNDNFNELVRNQFENISVIEEDKFNSDVYIKSLKEIITEKNKQIENLEEELFTLKNDNERGCSKKMSRKKSVFSFRRNSAFEVVEETELDKVGKLVNLIKEETITEDEITEIKKELLVLENNLKFFIYYQGKKYPVEEFKELINKLYSHVKTKEGEEIVDKIHEFFGFIRRCKSKKESNSFLWNIFGKKNED